MTYESELVLSMEDTPKTNSTLLGSVAKESTPTGDSNDNESGGYAAEVHPPKKEHRRLGASRRQSSGFFQSLGLVADEDDVEPTSKKGARHLRTTSPFDSTMR